MTARNVAVYDCGVKFICTRGNNAGATAIDNQAVVQQVFDARRIHRRAVTLAAVGVGEANVAIGLGANG